MISVCVATYNGHLYIKRQIDSIISQIGDNDEIVISDDNSSDDTVAILEAYRDPRIKIFKGNFHSPVLNFENALKHAVGDYIFLADQDDKWLDGRVKKAFELHKQGVDFVVANVVNVYPNGLKDPRNINPIRNSFVCNLIKPRIIGCTLSFGRTVMDYALPFPKGIAMHDIWIGLLAMEKFKCGYIDDPVIEYNRHSESFIATHKRSLLNKLYYRLHLLYHLKKRLREK